MEEQNNTKTQSVEPTTVEPKNKKSLTMYLVALLIFAAGAGGGYLLNSDDSTDEPVNTETVVVEEQTKDETAVEDSDSEVLPPAEEAVTPSINSEVNNTELFSSGYRNETAGIMLDFVVGAGFTDYWAEIGQTPDGLSLQTTKQSNGLGQVIENYGGFVIVVDPVDLPEGDNIYFYRIAATKDGVVQYTGVNSFNYK